MGFSVEAGRSEKKLFSNWDEKKKWFVGLGQWA